MTCWSKKIVVFTAMMPFITSAELTADCEDEGFINNCVEFYVEHGLCNMDSPDLESRSLESMVDQYPPECYDCPNIGARTLQECAQYRPSGRTVSEDLDREVGPSYVVIDLLHVEANENRVINLAEVKAYSEGGNLLRASEVAMSSKETGKGAENCNDSDEDTYCESNSRDSKPGLRLAYPPSVKIAKIEVVNRQDCCQDLIVGFRLALYKGESVAYETYFREEQSEYEFEVDEDPRNVELPESTEEEEEDLSIMKMLRKQFDDVMKKFNEDGDPEFCWRNAYGRTAGRIGSKCPAGKERVGFIGFFCYDMCPKGWHRVRHDGVAIDATCYQDCPEGWLDIGIACSHNQMKDKDYLREQSCPNPFRKKSQVRCEEKYGEGNCEAAGWCWTPKCKEAEEDYVKYEGIGQWCRPTVDCDALNMIKGFQITGKTCTKRSPKLWPGIHFTECADDTERSGALCYPKCDEGFEGVGPVCWAQEPKDWVKCGMGAAPTMSKCLSIVKDQVMSVGTLVASIVSLGQSIAASGAASTAAQTPGLIEKAKDLIDFISKITEGSSQGQKLMTSLTKAAGVLANHDTFKTNEDVVRFIAKLTALFDKTGISDTVAAYTYPECSKYELDDNDEENGDENEESEGDNDEESESEVSA